MASYIRPTSPDILGPMLVQAPIDQLAQVARQKQMIYNGNVNALAAQVNDYMGLEKNAFYEFNKPRIQEFNRKAAAQLDKVGLADFSLQQNVINANSIYKPLMNDPYITKDLQMQGQVQEGMKSFQTFKAIDQKAAAEGKFSQTYSDENYLYWQRQVNKAKKAAPDQIDLYNIDPASAYIDIKGKLNKLAKDMDVKVVESGLSPEGWFIETVTNGQVGRVPIMQFFSSSLNENDWKQLDIQADNRKFAVTQAHLNESKALGVPMDEETAEAQMGEELYDRFIPHMKEQFSFHDKQYKAIKARVDQYDPLAKHTDAEAQVYANDHQLLDYHKTQKDNYDEYINRTPVKSIAGWRMFQENYKSSQIENIAYSYADATSQRKYEVNEFKMEDVKLRNAQILAAQKHEYDKELKRMEGAKDGKKDKAIPGLIPIGENTTDPQEPGKTYKHFVDYYKTQLDSRVKISDDYFDIINETDVFGKVSGYAEKDGKGSDIRLGETGLTATELNKIQQILAAQGVNIGDPKLSTVSSIKTELRKYQDKHTDELRKDPSYMGNMNADQRNYIKKIIQLDSSIQKLDEAQKEAWNTAVAGKPLGTDFAKVVKDRSGLKDKLEVSDFINSDGTIITKEEFLKKATSETDFVSYQDAKRNEAIARAAFEKATTTGTSDQGVYLAKLKRAEEATRKIDDTWGKVYDTNVSQVRTRLNDFYSDYYEKNGIKPQTYQVGAGVTPEDAALKNTVLQRGIQALQGGAVAEHWAGNYSDIGELQKMIGVLANADPKEIGSITTEEYGGGSNYTRIRLTTDALNKLKKENVGGKGISADLLEEVTHFGIRVKNIETPLSENSVGRSFIDLMLEHNKPVTYDLSVGSDFPFKAELKYQKRLGEERGDYKIKIETVIPDLNADGTFKTNERGGVLFKKGTVDDIQEAAMPIEQAGSANYILPTIAAEVVNKRTFYAWANGGGYLKHAAAIKSFSDLVQVFNSLYPDAQVSFDNIVNNSAPLQVK